MSQKNRLSCSHFVHNLCSVCTGKCINHREFLTMCVRACACMRVWEGILSLVYRSNQRLSELKVAVRTCRGEEINAAQSSKGSRVIDRDPWVKFSPGGLPPTHWSPSISAHIQSFDWRWCGVVLCILTWDQNRSSPIDPVSDHLSYTKPLPPYTPVTWKEGGVGGGGHLEMGGRRDKDENKNLQIWWFR